MDIIPFNSDQRNFNSNFKNKCNSFLESNLIRGTVFSTISTVASFTLSVKRDRSRSRRSS